jgi:hypothetical protein
MLNGPDGLVGRFLQEESLKMAAAARLAAPLQKPWNYSWGPGSTSYMPRSQGYLKSTVAPHMGYTRDRVIYGGVNAAYGPTLFLEKPADQLHHSYPFLSDTLYSVYI